jgi:mannose-6-phosphate isomerase-like protein (cupin superfamily)
MERKPSDDGPHVVGPGDGKAVDLGSLGVRFMVWSEESGGGFSLVEHPIPPRTLAAPLHRHTNEDEYSYILEGRMGAQLGDEVVHAEVGDLVFKPRDQWHAFWNAGDGPCRILEIISPGGVRAPLRGSGRAQGGHGPVSRRPLRDRVRLRERGTPLRGTWSHLPRRVTLWTMLGFRPLETGRRMRRRRVGT